MGKGKKQRLCLQVMDITSMVEYWYSYFLRPIHITSSFYSPQILKLVVEGRTIMNGRLRKIVLFLF